MGWGRFAVAVSLAFAAAGCGGDGEKSDGLAMEGAACLEPPWTPFEARYTNAAAKCDDAREFGFIMGRGKLASEKQIDAFLNRYRLEAHDVSGIVGSGYGLCCEGHWPQPAELCLSYTLRFCTTRVTSFVDIMEKHRASDPEFANLALPISIELEGLEGPRCDRDDPTCDALPYDDVPRKAPLPEQRRPVDPPRDDAKACSYDGECVKNGCGNECDHWTDGAMAGTCPFYIRLERAFCGCINAQCAWFTGD